ncbi:hypothetical protein K7W42_22095 [Deinococcus sp. HMF7604]|uniref:hypothetical protein n=1 Tax=Deinococcus betulae TaxID=2873312 RepID=UPI001CCFB1A9|nr:hypothetical protein [Deinococcus betulae]MBZ9753527.1 hypothetical protein [Deinococcus betulae]
MTVVFRLTTSLAGDHCKRSRIRSASQHSLGAATSRWVPLKLGEEDQKASMRGKIPCCREKSSSSSNEAGAPRWSTSLVGWGMHIGDDHKAEQASLEQLFQKWQQLRTLLDGDVVWSIDAPHDLSKEQRQQLAETRELVRLADARLSELKRGDWPSESVETIRRTGRVVEGLRSDLTAALNTLRDIQNLPHLDGELPM